MADSARGSGHSDPRPMVSEHACSQDFYSVKHEQLKDMVFNADAGRVAAVGDRLKAAHEQIKTVGEKLKQHMSRVKWEGEGAQAFHNWGASMGNAVLDLAEYSKAAGEAMVQASVDIVDAQNMPRYDKSLPKDEQQKRQQEAAKAVKKLAESYNSAGVKIASAKRPNFPPMPLSMLPAPRHREHLEDVPLSGPNRGSLGTSSTGPATISDASTSVPSKPSASNPGSDFHHTSRESGPQGSPTGEPSRPPVQTHVDGTVITPPSPHVPTVPNGDVPHQSHPVGLPSLPPVLPVPHSGMTGNQLPPAGEPGSTGPTGKFSGLSRQLPVAGTPEGPGVGRFGSAMGPRELPGDGVVGGCPVPRATGVGTTQPPRGTVVGTEPGSPQARPPMAHGPGAVGSTAGASGHFRPGGAVSGRRFASQTGGVVGGSASQRSTGSDRPFTPGGAGLVRGANGGSGDRKKGNARQGRSPDYLTEEEETWAQTDRRVVPPVVD